MEGDGGDGEQGAWLQVPGGPQLVLCALGVLCGGAVPEALPRGPRRLGEAGHGAGSRPSWAPEAGRGWSRGWFKAPTGAREIGCARLQSGPSGFSAGVCSEL